MARAPPSYAPRVATVSDTDTSKSSVHLGLLSSTEITVPIVSIKLEEFVYGLAEVG